MMATQQPSRLRPPQVNVRKPLDSISDPNIQDDCRHSKPVPNLNNTKMTIQKSCTKIIQKTNANSRGVKFSSISDTVKSIPKTVATSSKLAAASETQVILKKRRSVRAIGTTDQSKVVKPPSKFLSALGPQRVIKKRPSVRASILRKGTTFPLNRPKTQVITTRPVATKAVKRAGAPVPSEEPPKPKQARPKIPSWNYKERFTVLHEKYVELTENHKELVSKIEGFQALEELCNVRNKEIESLLKRVDDLERLSSHYHTEYDKVTEKHDTLNESHVLLNSKYNELDTKFKNLEKEHTSLLNKEKNNLQEIENQKKTINNLNNELTQTKTDLTLQCSNLQKENEILKQERQKLDNQRRALHNTIQDLKGNIRVFCRVRPPINEEENDQLLCNISILDDNFLDIRKSRETISQITGKINEQKGEFSFDRVFSSESTQEEVFEELSQLVQSALDGYHVCVFAYGQTGSGKTYTMQGGGDNNSKGMIPRTVDLIFNKIEVLQQAGWQYSVHASFLEIYNENIHDLLNMKSSLKHDILYNEGKGTTVSNMTLEPIDSAAELRRLMSVAQKNRATAATNFNEHSSRSHAVTQIHLQGVMESSNTIYTGSINLVDLAGSESAKTTSNERLTETKNINKSLSTLGDVMLALYNKSKHVPYRNSKLTYLLQSSLGGNSKTLMVVNISPFDDCFGESMSSLRFASKVKEVKTLSKRNKLGLMPPQTPK